MQCDTFRAAGCVRLRHGDPGDDRPRVPRNDRRDECCPSGLRQEQPTVYRSDSCRLGGDCLYGYATLGQKIEWMRENPLVCLEIDEVITPGHWTSVVVFGRYQELPHTPEYEAARRVAESLFQKHPAWWEPASVPLAGHERRTPIVFRIQIGGMTGRRVAPGSVTTSHVLGSASEARWPHWLAHVLRRVVGTNSR
jgi:nitroimidazol reductase NimA-like FMN-containing flavoprotein (pyridoxamine 5'-phosphate oxidase superfamily)